MPTTRSSSRLGRRARVLALALPAAAAIGCSTAPPPAPTPASPPGTPAAAPAPVSPSPAGGVGAVDWERYPYPADTCVPADAPEGTPVIDRTTFADAAYGDLTGDGRDEVVVSVLCDTGGTLRWSAVWLYGADPAGPDGVRRLAPVHPFTGRPGPEGAAIDARYLQSAMIAGGRLTTRWRVYTATDPNCCPSRLGTAHQHWDGAALVTDGDPVVTGAPPAG